MNRETKEGKEEGTLFINEQKRNEGKGRRNGRRSRRRKWEKEKKRNQK